jgi:hypothetical protein
MKNKYFIEKFLNYTTLKNHRLLIAMDFDGTLVEHIFPDPGVGKKIQIDISNWIIENNTINLNDYETKLNTIDIVKYWKSFGHEIILYTCREDKLFNDQDSLTDAVNYCKSEGLIFNYINENHKNSCVGRKILADKYVDDRAANNIKHYDNWNMKKWKISFPTGLEILSI